MVTREFSLEPYRTGTSRLKDRLRSLNLRIGFLAMIVVMELWGLTVALHMWGAEDLRALPAVFGAQLAGFLAAVAIWVTAPPALPATAPLATIATQQPAVATE